VLKFSTASSAVKRLFRIGARKRVVFSGPWLMRLTDRYMCRYPQRRCAALESRLLSEKEFSGEFMQLLSVEYYLEHFPAWKEGQLFVFCSKL
jgi:hypothetical protein